MLEDTNWHLLFAPSFWGGVALMVLLWWIPASVARKSLDGGWRSWVLAPAIPFQISPRNTWPFMFGAASTALVFVLLSLPAEVLGWERVREGLWNLFFVPWAFVVVSFVWWPLSLSPRWYRAWARAGGTRQTNPWTPQEVAAVRSAPPSKRRDRHLADIERCLAATQRVGKPTPRSGAESEARTADPQEDRRP